MLLLADLHYGDTTDALSISGISTKSYDTTRRVFEAINVAKQGKHTIVILGDLYDSKLPSPEAIREMIRVLNYAKAAGVEIVVFPGNHDSASKWTALISISEIDYDSFTVITQPRYFDIDGMTAYVLPHMPKSEEAAVFEKMKVDSYTALAAAAYAKDEYDVLLSHAQVQGVQGSSEREMEAGNAISLNMQELPEGLAVYLGHVHDHAVHLTPAKQVVCYPGGVIPHTFGELDSVKGYVLVSAKKPRSPVFVPFTTPMTYEYVHLKINLTNKTHLAVGEAKLRELTEHKLMKVTVRVNDRRSVDLLSVRKLLGTYGTILRFEVIDTSMRALTAPGDEPVHAHLDHMSLLHEALVKKQQQGASKEILLLAARYGKEIIKHAD